MAIFGNKKQQALQAERESFLAKVNQIAEDCQIRVQGFPGMTIQGKDYSANDLKEDVAHLIYSSAERADEAIAWWTTKVTALISDSGVGIPIHDLAKNLLWCKTVAQDTVDRYKGKGEHLLLTKLNNVDQACWASMEKNPEIQEVTEYLALHTHELATELGWKV